MQNRKFYTDNQGRYYVCLSEARLAKTDEPCFTLEDLYVDTELVVMTEHEMAENGFTECEGYEVYGPAGKDYEKVQQVNARIGVGYICPFCGGTLRWENDFMMSELGLVGGDNAVYIKIEDEETVAKLVKEEDEMIKSNILSYTDNIDSDNERFDSEGYYSTLYKKEVKDGVVSWYEANDAVVGLYTCQYCGKHYEVSDCLPSEQNEYPYFQK